MIFGQSSYRLNCRFCHGAGCFDCDVKGDRAREISLNNPLVFKTNSPEDMERLKTLIGEAAFVSREDALNDAVADLISAIRKDGDEK